MESNVRNGTAMRENPIAEMHVTDSHANDGFAKVTSAGETLPAKSVGRR